MLTQITPAEFDLWLQNIKNLDYSGYAEQYPPFASWPEFDKRPAAALSAWRKNRFKAGATGLFVNVPFCRARCKFCFLPVTAIGAADAAPYFAGYFDTLIKEISLYGTALDGTEFETLYVGGGTPSLMTPREISVFFNILRKRFRTAKTKQILLELHPGDITPGKLSAYMEAGVNRVCLGVQSLDGDVLQKSGRKQKLEQVVKACLEIQRRGFAKINLDIICGLPGQSRSSFLSDLITLARIKPDQFHLNTFINTPYTLHARTGWRGPDEKTVESIRKEGFSILSKYGYLRLDPDSMGLTPQSKNIQTSDLSSNKSVFGLGPGAVSRIYSSARYMNKPLWTDYKRAVENGMLPIERWTRVSVRQEMIHYLISQLSDNGAAAFRGFKSRFGRDPHVAFPKELAALKKAGATVNDGEIRAPAFLWNPIRRIFYQRSVVKRAAEAAAMKPYTPR